jgi:hypothetical protein
MLQRQHCNLIQLACRILITVINEAGAPSFLSHLRCVGDGIIIHSDHLQSRLQQLRV